MSYEPRTIALVAEILHQPVQLRPETVQGIHNALYRRREIGYQNFQVAADGIHLSNPSQTPGSVSAATFVPDRIVLREEFRPCTVEEFASRVVNVTTLSYQTLRIPLTIVQQFCIRSLVNPEHYADSRDLVASAMIAGGQESLAQFGRPMQAAGLRFTFPQTEDEPGTLNLRIEPWLQDPQSIWVEVIGQFAQPVTTENLPHLSSYLYSVYKFTTGPALEYLSQFDAL